jgi:hypothetical protein
MAWFELMVSKIYLANTSFRVWVSPPANNRQK